MVQWNRHANVKEEGDKNEVCWRVVEGDKNEACSEMRDDGLQLDY